MNKRLRSISGPFANCRFKKNSNVPRRQRSRWTFLKIILLTDALATQEIEQLFKLKYVFDLHPMSTFFDKAVGSKTTCSSNFSICSDSFAKDSNGTMPSNRIAPLGSIDVIKISLLVFAKRFLQSDIDVELLDIYYYQQSCFFLQVKKLK